MIDLGATVNSLVPVPVYTGYFGNKEVNPANYASLVVNWEDARPIPTYNEVVAEATRLQNVEDDYASDMVSFKQKMANLIKTTTYADIEDIADIMVNGTEQQKLARWEIVLSIILHYGKAQIGPDHS